MEILKSAAAGTLESSDCMVTVEPGEGITLDLSSSVMNQYGRQIKAAVLETLERLDVKNANVTVVDKGALAVFAVAQQGAADLRHGDPDLVGPAGQQAALHQRQRAAALQRFVQRDGGLAAGDGLMVKGDLLFGLVLQQKTLDAAFRGTAVPVGGTAVPVFGLLVGGILKVFRLFLSC